jgi:ribA/ribD-fused uncharacterized protein
MVTKTRKRPPPPVEALYPPPLKPPPAKVKERPILEFKGEYEFLSNFYPCDVHSDGAWYPSLEHAFQAMKTSDPALRRAIAKLPTAGQAKAAGRRIKLELENWNRWREGLMYNLLWHKFQSNSVLRARLAATGDRILIEGNWWHDNYWGVCYCFKRPKPTPADAGCAAYRREAAALGQVAGENRLGRLLMTLRDEIRLGIPF